MQDRFLIERIEARILDIPTIRPHKLSFGSISRQSPVIVQLWLRNGATGFGEAATIGGPSWNEESPESIHHAITNHLAPSLIGQDGARFEACLSRMDLACKGNAFAKSAVEIALMDAVARSLQLPLWQLLGGKQRDSLPLAWTLASGDIERDLAEAHLRLEQKRHRIFKMKIGARTPEADVAHVSEIARGLQGRATLTVDVNQAWDGATARRFLPQLIDAGVTYFHTDFRNKIEYAPLGRFNGIWWTRMSNVQRARTSGMEGNLNVRFGEQWRWRTSATWMKEARNLTTGRNLIDTPEFSGYSSLDWTPSTVFSSSLSAQYTGKQTGTATTFLKAYTLYDLTAAWNVNEVLTLRGGISNLADKKLYAEGSTDYFVGGRSYFLSMTARF